MASSTFAKKASLKKDLESSSNVSQGAGQVSMRTAAETEVSFPVKSSPFKDATMKGVVSGAGFFSFWVSVDKEFD